MHRYKNVTETVIIFPTILTDTGSLLVEPGDVFETDLELFHPGLELSQDDTTIGHGVAIIDDDPDDDPNDEADGETPKPRHRRKTATTVQE